MGSREALIYSVSDLSTPQVLAHFVDFAWRVLFSPDGRYLVVAGDDRVLIFKIGTGDLQCLDQPPRLQLWTA